MKRAIQIALIAFMVYMMATVACLVVVHYIGVNANPMYTGVYDLTRSDQRALALERWPELAPFIKHVPLDESGEVFIHFGINEVPRE